MKRADDKEIYERKKSSFIRKEFFTIVLLGLIPLVNGFCYLVFGRTNALVAESRTKIRLIYLSLSVILFFHPFISLYIARDYGEGAGWVCYILTAVFSAKKHIRVTSELGQFDRYVSYS